MSRKFNPGPLARRTLKWLAAFPWEWIACVLMFGAGLVIYVFGLGA